MAGPQQEGGKPQAVQGKTQTVPLLTCATLAFPTSLPTCCRGNGKGGGGRKTSFLGSSAIASPCIRISGAWCWRKDRQHAKTQGTVYSGTCALLMGCLGWPHWGCGPSDTQCWGGLGLWGGPLRLEETYETQVLSLGWEDLLEEGMASHSSILAWRIPWTEEPERLQSTGSHRVGHN